MRVENLRQGYTIALTTVLKHGELREIMGMKCLEICGLRILMQNPQDSIKELIIKKAKSYHEHVYPQRSPLILHLQDHPNSRQAVIVNWNDKTLSLGMLDRGHEKYQHPPCVIAYQFFIRDGNLNMSVFQRSSDVYKVLASDLMHYQALMRTVAKAHADKPRVGVLDIYIGSAHIFLEDMMGLKLKAKDHYITVDV